MKKCLLLILLFCVLLSACTDKQEQKDEQGMTQNTPSIADDEVHQASLPELDSMTELEQAKRYYTYLNEVVLQEKRRKL